MPSPIPIPPAAAGTADELTALFAVFLAAKIGDELFKRIGQPALVGEILMGVLIGPSVIGLIEPDELLEVFAELGIVFLLFWVGLETKISDLREVGRASTFAGGLGVAIPFSGGLGFAFAIGESGATAIFIGAALVATSVGITSAVLLEMNLIRHRASRTILGAAVIDDVLALLLLSIAAGVAGGSVGVSSVLVTLGLALAFIAFFALGGTSLARARPGLLHAPRFAESPLLPAVLLCLGLASFAAQVGLAAIIGAFLAGMIVAETKEHHPIEEEVAPLYALFPPFFFVFIGLSVDLGELASGGALLLLLAVTVLAVATKFAGAWLGSRSLGATEAAFVGVGMVPRGEVGIIVAGIGEATGVVDAELFAVIVGMSIATTLIVPPALRRLATSLYEPDEGAESPDKGRQPSGSEP